MKNFGVNDKDDEEYNSDVEMASTGEPYPELCEQDEETETDLSTISNDDDGLFEELVEEHFTIDNNKVYKTLREPTLFRPDDLSNVAKKKKKSKRTRRKSCT